MDEISGSAKSLRELLGGNTYYIHYYQREYMWQTKQVEELLDDLTSEFLVYYDGKHIPKDVKNYGTYFMGSIVLAGTDKAIIDGQQRLSTLTLILMYLNNRLKELNQHNNTIETMIYSDDFTEKSFNINVDERAKCMDAIFNNKQFDVKNENESVINLYGRYNDIIELFPKEDIEDNMLLNFSYWLIEKVVFIEINATTEQDAHKIFVTMNDRGLSLTSTEMLKGYLLSEIKDDKRRAELNDDWKDKILDLKRHDDSGDDIFIKSWLRAQYADTIREGKKGAENKDFDIIGGQFHKWVQEKHSEIGLNNSDDYVSFIEEFKWFADAYIKIREAENKFNDETKFIYYNARVNFTLQTQLLLAPLCFGEDTSEEVIEKINLVARFIDLYILSRFTNGKSLNYSTIKNNVFNITKDIRRCSIDKLKERLNIHYNNFEHSLEHGIPGLQLNGRNKKYIKNMLARITEFLEEQTDVTPNYSNYMAPAKNPFEIEHILSDHYERFTDDFNDQTDFNNWRNNIGALLLLHKSINASINDSDFKDKLEAYSTKGNIYSASLDYSAYNDHPRFNRFIEENNLPFKPYSKFKKSEIKERNDLVIQLAKLIWNNDMFVK